LVNYSAAMNATLLRLFDEYAADHRHPMNRLTHKIAIPLIVFHIVAMLDWWKLGPAIDIGGVPLQLSAGHIGYAAAIAYYLSKHVKLAAVMAVLMALCFPLAAVTPKPVVVVLAVAAWLVQLAGHSVFEKNRPSFTKNLQQALIGPLFFVAVLAGVYRPGAARA
jgi:uncharacterized membrane protein YGL010W